MYADSAILNMYDCHVHGDITASECGGMVGAFLGAYSVTYDISHCSHTGNITGNRSGGITGNSIHRCTSGKIRYCSQTGGVISGADCGGIVGKAFSDQNSIISNCFCTSDITGLRSGGIAGSYFAGRQ